MFNRRIDKDDSPAASINEKDTIPILPPPPIGTKKTNSEMMDDLMQATFKAENGAVDARNPQPGVPAAYGQRPGFMNETTYTALAGPPTPVAAPRPPVERRSKPVIQWLDNVRTPSQAPVTPGSANWPGPDYPPMPPPPAQARGPQGPSQQGVPVGRPPADQFMPPQPPFQKDQRYTQTTTTTSTTSSNAWYG